MNHLFPRRPVPEPVRRRPRRFLPGGHVPGIVLLTVFLCVPQAPLLGQGPTRESLPGATATMLAAGDLIRIEVWRQPEFSGDFGIAGDGSIRHPLYQDVQIAGVPLATARERVRAFLSDFITDPQFVITPLLSVAIGGEVDQPNLYNLPPEVTVSEAVAGAGGPTEDGRLDHVRLLRGGQEWLLDLTQADAELARMTIRSGDQILVGRRRNIWREYIAPVASVTGAAASILNAVLRARN